MDQEGGGEEEEEETGEKNVRKSGGNEGEEEGRHNGHVTHLLTTPTKRRLPGSFSFSGLEATVAVTCAISLLQPLPVTGLFPKLRAHFKVWK